MLKRVISLLSAVALLATISISASANNDIYAYMPNAQTVRATLKTEFIYIPVAQHDPYMHVYHLYGDGKYGFMIYE